MAAYLRIRRTSSSVKTRHPFRSRCTSSTRPERSQRFKVMGATSMSLATWDSRYFAMEHPYQAISFRVSTRVILGSKTGVNRISQEIWPVESNAGSHIGTVPRYLATVSGPWGETASHSRIVLDSGSQFPTEPDVPKFRPPCDADRDLTSLAIEAGRGVPD